MEFAEEMLTTALDYVRAKEEVEEEHASTAHKAFEKAVDQEKVLESFAKEVQHDAEDADIILKTYEKEHYYEDREERREMAVADVAHHVDSYVESRLHEAREMELHARQEEEEAKRIYEELRMDEEALEASLNELQALKEQKQKNLKQEWGRCGTCEGKKLHESDEATWSN